jgi:hypothetical protein
MASTCVRQHHASKNAKKSVNKLSSTIGKALSAGFAFVDCVFVLVAM